MVWEAVGTSTLVVGCIVGGQKLGSDGSSTWSECDFHSDDYFVLEWKKSFQAAMRRLIRMHKVNLLSSGDQNSQVCGKCCV